MHYKFIEEIITDGDGNIVIDYLVQTYRISRNWFTGKERFHELLTYTHKDKNKALATLAELKREARIKHEYHIIEQGKL